MKFLTTLLTATAMCAAMLAAIAYRVGDLPSPEPWAGLTTATVLGTVDPSDSVRASSSPFDRGSLSRLVDETSRADRGGSPADGSKG